MTTIRQIIIDAFREGGLTQTGVTPEADEFDEGLRKVQTIIAGLFGNEAGVPLTPLSYGTSGVTNSSATALDTAPVIDSYYVPSNSQLLVNLSEAKTVYLDPNPLDGARLGIIDVAGNFATHNLTLNANGRKIDGASTAVLSTNSQNKEWFYRADLGQWSAITDLVAGDTSPLPSKYDDLLITYLAMRLNPRYQSQTAPETMEVYKNLLRKFRAQYKQVTTVYPEEALWRLTGLNVWHGADLNLAQFNRGLFS